MKFYPLAKPYLKEAEIQAVTRVIKSGVLSLGPVHKKFENAFAKKIGTRYACAVSSGTAGLHLGMIAAGIKAGDEVITTPFSFVASSNCILYQNARPVFVDIDPVTFNLDPSKIEKKITKKTRVILVVHIFGQPADMNPILKLAKKYNLKVIEDACESLGATYRGRKVGTFGESAVFAFYPNKQITTGEGGMLVTNHKKIYELASSLRNQGRADDLQWLDHRYLGYNYRLDEMSAALGLVQLQKLDWLIEKRRKLAKLYTRHLTPYRKLVSLPQVAAGNTHTWFIYVVLLNNPRINRDQIIKKLQKQGIQTKPYLPSIHLFNFYRKKFGFKPGDFEISETTSRTALALPFYIGLREEDIKDIVNKLIKVLQSYDS